MLQGRIRYLNNYSQYPDVSPRTREILRNEHWSENGPPLWRVGKAQRPAQTAEEANDESCKLVKRLRSYAANHTRAEALANRLDSCAPNRRCMSGACPECSRAYARWFVASSAAVWGDVEADLSILSLVHSDLSVPVGRLTPDHIKMVKRKVHTILTRAGVTTFVGGIDISVNEHENNAFEPHFQPQSWLLGSTDVVRKAERKLRAAFPKTETTPRPVKILQWDGDLAALAYALKNTFDRRVSYAREAKESGSKHACRNTRDRALRVEQHIELLIAFDQAGFHARLHLGGCRIVRTADGPMIRPIENEKGRCSGDQ